MTSHPTQAKVTSTQKEKESSLLEYTTLSEPEDSISSGVDSFDEDDMYPVDYDDEAVSDSSDSDKKSQSPSRTSVCLSLHM
jgi:hypothetical protein